jgi:hypothetical protein
MTLPILTGTQIVAVVSLVIAILSVVLSAVTLFVSHLRGSDVRLIQPGGLYPAKNPSIHGAPANEFGVP